jgi:hypothetical protein
MSKLANPRVIRAILTEILSSLPGRHKRALSSEPDNPVDFRAEGVYTGALNHDQQIRVWEKVLGLLFWFGWFGFGVYFWWFTDVPLLDYLIGTAVWTVIFIFTLIGIPVVRVILREREQR